MNRIQRYILRETIAPFLVGVSFFTLLFMIPRLQSLVRLIVEKNVPTEVVLRLFLYIIPATTSLTIPMGVLFGVLFALGRLNNDSEIVAIRANGGSLWSICFPIFSFGIIMTGLLFLFYNFVMPESNLRYKTLYTNAIYSSPGILMEEQFFVSLPGSQKKITAISYDEESQVMYSVYIYDEDPNNKESSLIYAKRGEWASNEINSSFIKLKLENGEIIRLDEQQKGSIERVHFDKMEVNIFVQIRQIELASQGLREQSIFEVWELIKKRREQNIEITPLVWVEFHKKVSIPLAAFIFVLVGIPLSLTTVRSKGASLGISLIIILVYHIFQTSGDAMGRFGILSGEISTHLPNIVIGIWGLLLLLRKIRE